MTTPQFHIQQINHTADLLNAMDIGMYQECREEFINAVTVLRGTLEKKERVWFHSPEYQQKLREAREAAIKKKQTTKALETRVAEWAEENLQEGDFVKFIGTRGEPWRLVQSIERTNHPEYYASRVHGSVICWKHTTIPYAAYTFSGTSSVNGMEKIALVVRNGVEVFNRKNVHSKKQ